MKDVWRWAIVGSRTTAQAFPDAAKGGRVSYTGYWCSGQYVYGPGGYTGFYFSGEHIYGPGGYTGCLLSGQHLYGPGGYLECWISDNHVYGKASRLPWAKGPRR
jgi:hypothetical protein